MATERPVVYRLWVAYDGGPYQGFQIQPGRRTVQEEIEAAIARLTGERQRIRYAGRTDTGVHAYGQVVAVTMPTPWSPDRLTAALNAHLPHSVVVWRAEPTDASFDPRRQAISRLYRYLIEQTPWPLPFWRPYRWHVRDPLDIAAMRTAAAALVGTHDFAAFTDRSGREVGSTIRRLDRITITRSGETLALEFEGNAFLPHFVRNVVGTLVAVGAGRLNASQLSHILASRDRRLAGPAAPGHGLYLVRVRYPGDPPDTGEGDWR